MQRPGNRLKRTVGLKEIALVLVLLVVRGSSLLVLPLGNLVVEYLLGEDDKVAGQIVPNRQFVH